jgi:hypothetical protein
MSRSFTIVDIKGIKKGQECLGGRYLSEQPSSAAKKAAQKVCQACGVKGVCSLVISVRETTRGGNGKVYTYKASREKSDKVVVRNGVEIHYKYQFFVKSMRSKQQQ